MNPKSASPGKVLRLSSAPAVGSEAPSLKGDSVERRGSEVLPLTQTVNEN